jgi:hypothetical protein
MIAYCVNVTATYTIAIYSRPAMNFLFTKSMHISSGRNSVAVPNILYSRSQCYLIRGAEVFYYIFCLLLTSLNINNRNASEEYNAI